MADRILARPTRRQTILPVALVLVSLISLALLSVLTMQKTRSERERIAAFLQPARVHVTRIQSAIALESAAVRGFLLTRDPEVARHHVQARAVRDRALRGLRALAPGLSPVVRTRLDELARITGEAEPRLDSLFQGNVDRSQFESLVERHDQLQDVLGAAAAMDHALGEELAAHLQRISRIQIVNTVLTIAFVILALASALLVARLGQRLGASEERFRQLAEAVHDFVWLSDKDLSHHLFANAAYERIWGRPREELYANPQSLLEGVHPDDRQRVLDAIENLPRGPYDTEFRVVRPDGEQRWVWSRGFPIPGARGGNERVASVTEDITERKLAAESRTRLIRGFTHDVKNPLGAADGFLALLEQGIQGPLTSEQADSITRVRQSIRVALDLTGQLLDIARAEAGQLDIELAPTRIEDTARDVMEEFRAKATAKSLALEYEGARSPSDEPLVIESDAKRIRQVLANLLSNAVKYTPSGRVTLRVSERTGRDAPTDGDWVTIVVADTGPGVPAEKQAMLFREFSRFDPGAAEGSGIGLAISQRIAEALGGSITYASRPGAGSIFTLWLPRRQRAD